MITSEANVHGATGVSVRKWENHGTRGLTINLGSGVAAFVITFYNDGIDTACDLAREILRAVTETESAESAFRAIVNGPKPTGHEYRCSECGDLVDDHCRNHPSAIVEASVRTFDND